MKTKSPKFQSKGGSSKPKTRDKESGIAIVTVLSVLMMMTLLVFGFFSAATEELKSSTYYGSSLKTRQLTDVVTNMVIAQIRKATGEQKSEGQRFTWVSQPGCITTFTNRGSDYDTLAVAKYKLYSSETMEIVSEDNAVDDIDQEWNKKPHHYVDLNAPLFSERENELYFPIVDPRARRSTNDKNKDNVEGFNYSQTTSTGTQVPGVILPGSDPKAQRLPMPAQWLYILEDGTMGHIDKSDKFVPGSGIGKASISNPIVARIAFWTDDECNKINVNTASEGVPWDIPRYDSRHEREMAMKQPVEKETSRFPGHPSMVSLSSVLYPHEDVSEDKAKLRNIYDLVPKVEYKNSSASGARGTQGVTWDNDRLYATYDELLYKHERNRGLEERQEANTFRSSQISRRKLEQSRFFLTANSIGPETTLFGTPRMTMWPTFTNVGKNTYFDNLMVFISTLGTNKRKYYWQRNGSDSRHNEIYGNAGGDNLRLLNEYLVNLISQSNQIPGYGGSLGRKYGSGPYQDGKQILTQCWDYVRTTNLNDPYNRTQYTSNTSPGQVAGCCLCGGTSPHRTRWDKPYLKFPRGFGRLPTLTEVALVFKATGSRSGDGMTSQGNIKNLPPGGVNIEVGLLLETFCPSHGFTKMVPSTSLQVIGGRFGNNKQNPATITINNVNIGDLTAGNNHVVQGERSHLKGFRGWGAHGGPRQHRGRNGLYWTPQGENPTVGGAIPVAAGSGNLRVQIQGAPDRVPASEPDMRIVLYDTPSGAENREVGNLIQVFEVDFPNEFNIPIPRYENRDSIKQTLSKARNNPERLIGAGTVVRSLVVSHSDFRLLGAKRVIENHVLQPHPDFFTNEMQAHSLVDPDGYKYTGFRNEREFILGAGYSEIAAPDFPISPENPNFFVDVRGNPRTDYKFSVDPMVTGDWDNGIAMHMDGPYVNRGDDGNRVSGNRNPYFDEKALSSKDLTNKANFSPNRVICGPGMFGSMSTGVQEGIPWRTLLFRPDSQHFGAADQPNQGDPPDHLWMDLFWMPVVEPYAISMPAATRGKINMNTQIVPFDYIKRNTAIHALMKAETVLAIPTNAGNRYKEENGGDDSWRRKIDAYETLKQWEDKFKENRLFRSPTEICEMYLVPEGQTLGAKSGKDYPKMRQFWEQHKLTGDNTKERPYANMHPRLTTKSNVFKVHMIVQTFRKAKSTAADVVDPAKDKAIGTWRGSALIERFIDPSDNKIPDYFNDPNMTKPSLEEFYNYRVLNVKQFAL